MSTVIDLKCGGVFFKIGHLELKKNKQKIVLDVLKIEMQVEMKARFSFFFMLQTRLVLEKSSNFPGRLINPALHSNLVVISHYVSFMLARVKWSSRLRGKAGRPATNHVPRTYSTRDAQ